MKDLKIGTLTFKPTAIKKIAWCLFFNVLLIAAVVVVKKTTGFKLGIGFGLPLMFLPYLLNLKEIRDNVIEEPPQ